MNIDLDVAQMSIVELQALMAAGELSAHDLTEVFLARIAELDDAGPALHSILELNPDALEMAAAYDRERREGYVRGPLHGIPVLLKDNVDTADRQMTTAGSLALVGFPADRDATVVTSLRAAGCVLLGKTNMSEWANLRSSFSSSGWCARNGQSRNPYILDRNPSGSSSGSAVAVAAALAPLAVGTETDGSIVGPAGANGVVGIKPTVGLVSRAGVIPISHTQDTVGVFGRSVADAACALTCMAVTAVDPRDEATREAVGHAVDYSSVLDPAALKGARIGIARNLGFGAGSHVDPIMESAIQALREAGAVIVDPGNIPSDLEAADKAERTVLLTEFKADLENYLATRHDVALDREGFPLTLAGLIDFDEAHRDLEMPYFGHDLFLAAEASGPLTNPAYRLALETSRLLSGPLGIDAVLDEHHLDALIAPTNCPAWPIDLINGDREVVGTSGPAARAGYPLVSVPADYVFGLPVNITFMGHRFSEARLIALAFAFEQVTQVRRPPRFLPTVLPI